MHLVPRFWFGTSLLLVLCILEDFVALPVPGIEWLIIKFDLCVCFDYCSLLTGEAPRPCDGGIQYINRPTRVGNASSGSYSGCVRARGVCVCCDGWGRPLPALLPWCFPAEKGLINERARGVLENETRDGCWQRPGKCTVWAWSHANIRPRITSVHEVTEYSSTVSTLEWFEM